MKRTKASCNVYYVLLCIHITDFYPLFQSQVPKRPKFKLAKKKMWFYFREKRKLEICSRQS
jgi:hypothetical protein